MTLINHNQLSPKILLSLDSNQLCGDRIDGRFLQSLTMAVVLASFFADSGLMKAVIPTRSIRSSRQLTVHQ